VNEGKEQEEIKKLFAKKENPYSYNINFI